MQLVTKKATFLKVTVEWPLPIASVEGGVLGWADPNHLDRYELLDLYPP